MVSVEYDYNFKLRFHSEWLDPIAQRIKNFTFSFFPSDNTIELFDADLKRTYLKRSSYEGLRLKDIFVGNLVTIYGRQIKLNDYADCRTRDVLGKSKERTFGMIKPSGMDNFGEIIDEIYKSDFTVSDLRMSVLNRKTALEFYARKKGEAYLPFVIEHVCSSPVVAMELIGENAVERWREIVGPVDPTEAKKTAPNSFRAKYGSDITANALHSAGTATEAVNSACFFFPKGIDKKPPDPTTKLVNSTCCVIKPHAIDEGNLGKIIGYIQKHNFHITALQMFHLSTANADEYLEVYKGVVTDFQSVLTSFLNGPCVAMEISGNESMNVHQEFRKFCGPSDSDIARQIRPKTIRGVFGTDKYRNAVHCTDLPEDTTLELEYFFNILNVS